MANYKNFIENEKQKLEKNKESQKKQGDLEQMKNAKIPENNANARITNAKD